MSGRLAMISAGVSSTAIGSLAGSCALAGRLSGRSAASVCGVPASSSTSRLRADWACSNAWGTAARVMASCDSTRSTSRRLAAPCSNRARVMRTVSAWDSADLVVMACCS